MIDDVGIETGVHVEQLVDAANQQAGAGEEHDGERDLGDDESAAQLSPARAGSLRAVLERVLELGARHEDAPGRDQTRSP